MTGAPDLSWISLLAAIALLAVPVALSLWLRLGVVRESIVAVARMAVQLFAAGLLLKYLFVFDHAWLNLIWLGVMMLVASLTTVQKSRLRLSRLLLPVCAATFCVTLVMTLFFNAFIVRIDDLFEARYLVVIGGMILGNALSGNIVSLTHFFSALSDHESRYLYFLGNGEGQREALRPFFREAMIRALKPALASLATIGIVALPGMMTGQMLGGSAPMVAIKYQIAIMMVIFATQSTGMALTIVLSTRIAFDPYGVLRPDTFARRKESDA